MFLTLLVEGVIEFFLVFVVEKVTFQKKDNKITTNGRFSVQSIFYNEELGEMIYDVILHSNVIEPEESPSDSIDKL